MICPFCKSETFAVIVPPMSKRRWLIYEAVANAGSDGIKASQIVLIMSEGSHPSKAALGVMRVQIHALNKIIEPLGQRIISKRARKFLVGLK